MKRRGFVAGSFALAAAGACAKAPPAKLPYLSAEQLLARAKENGLAGKVTAFHFWATWCGPCIQEFPLIEREWRGWIRDDKALDFLGVSVDEPDLPSVKRLGFEAASRERDDSVRKFIAELGGTFPNAIADAPDGADEFADQIDTGWPAVLPSTLLFGLDGALSYRNIGELRVSRFRDKVREALEKKP